MRTKILLIVGIICLTLSIATLFFIVPIGRSMGYVLTFRLVFVGLILGVIFLSSSFLSWRTEHFSKASVLAFILGFLSISFQLITTVLCRLNLGWEHNRLLGVETCTVLLGNTMFVISTIAASVAFVLGVSALVSTLKNHLKGKIFSILAILFSLLVPGYWAAVWLMYSGLDIISNLL